jgi:glutaredoxin
MYGRDTCGYTVKMKKNIDESDKKHMFTYIDVTTPEGSIKYEKLNVQGVPAFSYNGKTVVGAMPIDNLLKKLNI